MKLSILEWKVGSRLIGGFSLAFILAILIFAISAISLSSLKNTSNKIIDEYFPSTIVANTLIDGVNLNYISVIELALTNDKEKNHG
ncbi:hypothetical protein NMD86_06530 [Edwardsiella tarda]|uniref:hypothetical protein n=1 Tax=Edwardsiella tarda TaxID=636 RepID=UPI00351CB46E